QASGTPHHCAQQRPGNRATDGTLAGARTAGLRQFAAFGQVGFIVSGADTVVNDGAVLRGGRAGRHGERDGSGEDGCFHFPFLPAAVRVVRGSVRLGKQCTWEHFSHYTHSWNVALTDTERPKPVSLPYFRYGKTPNLTRK